MTRIHAHKRQVPVGHAWMIFLQPFEPRQNGICCASIEDAQLLNGALAALLISRCGLRRRWRYPHRYRGELFSIGHGESALGGDLSPDDIIDEQFEEFAPDIGLRKMVAENWVTEKGWHQH